MIKATTTAVDGRRVLILGLSGENMTRLVNDEPIAFGTGVLNIGWDGHVMLAYGKTEQAIQDALTRRGLAARALPDHPPELNDPVTVLAQVRRLHRQVVHDNDALVLCEECRSTWPCPTVLALDGYYDTHELPPSDLEYTEYECPQCGRWARWTDGALATDGADEDEYWCQTCGAEVPVAECSRRTGRQSKRDFAASPGETSP